MKLNSNTFFILLVLITIVFTTGGCHSNKDGSASTYTNYKFDSNVIKRLPDYDSLALSIFEKIDLFKQGGNSNESYRAYRYMPSSDEKNIFKALPPNAGSKIDYYYKKLGKDFIYGFDIFRDSSIKIFIKTYQLKPDPIIVDENLSYYPVENKMKKREFPDKDTVLTKHWQYWIRFRQPDGF